VLSLLIKVITKSDKIMRVSINWQRRFHGSSSAEQKYDEKIEFVLCPWLGVSVSPLVRSAFVPFPFSYAL
jgi:hypothetical protein